MRDVTRFLDDSQRLSSWPKKHADKQLVLEYLIEKFDFDLSYTESEVNEILNQWHDFQDWALLRRSLVDAGFFARDKNGYEYRRLR